MKRNQILTMAVTMAGLFLCFSGKTVLANGTSTNVTWNVSGEVLYIDGTGDMPDWAEGEDQPWIGYKNTIKSVEIGDGVTSVGDRAFEGYSNIVEVTIADSVKNIGEYSFAETSLRSLSLSTNVEVVEKGAFYNCMQLYKLEFNSSYTEILGEGETIPGYTTIYGYMGTYASRYAEDFYRSFDDSGKGEGLVVEVGGFQISSKVGGVRAVYSTNIPASDVTEVGVLYGLKYNGKDSQEEIDYEYTKIDDMRVGGDNFFVRKYPATQKGVSEKIFSDYENSRSYVMTMKFGPENEQYYGADYYIRAYVKLKTGQYVYSRIYQYSVYQVADVLYSNHQMNSKSDHDYLYNILKTVNPEYKTVDWDWDNSYAMGESMAYAYDYEYNPSLSIYGFQLSSTVPGVRTVYMSYYSEEDIDSVGLIYGLADQINDIGNEMVVGSSNQYVQHYEATENDKLPKVDMEGQKYTMTILYDNQSIASLSKNYYVRAYTKMKDGTYSYSEVFRYSPYSVADYLYQSFPMFSCADNTFIYENILKKVDPDYEELSYYWKFIITDKMMSTFNPRAYNY